jgi:hypothetical protein
LILTKECDEQLSRQRHDRRLAQAAKWRSQSFGFGMSFRHDLFEGQEEIRGSLVIGGLRGDVKKAALQMQLVTLYKALGGGWELHQFIPPIRQPQPAIIAATRRLLAPAENH